MTVPPPPEGEFSLEKSSCHGRWELSTILRAIAGIPFTIVTPISDAMLVKKVLGTEDPTVVETSGMPRRLVISRIVWFFRGIR